MENFCSKCVQIAGKHDLVNLEKEFTSTRGGNIEKESSLFKAYFEADVYFDDDPHPMSGISLMPIYDKGKYELRIDRIYPPIICNVGNHEITGSFFDMFILRSIIYSINIPKSIWRDETHKVTLIYVHATA
jgi:hypothetical protein